MVSSIESDRHDTFFSDMKLIHSPIFKDFWVYDTFNDSRRSAYKSALIAVACASAMVLLTSKSATIMLFSAISIGYVLVASCACLVGLGWSLGM